LGTGLDHHDARGVAHRTPEIGAVATLATVATPAGWLPAWRASRIDPAELLRET